MKREFIRNELRQKIYKRDGYACRYCGNTKNLQVDHVYPVSKGGATIEENLVTACSDCNVRKSSKLGIWPNPIKTKKARSYMSVGVLLVVLGIQFISLSHFGNPEGFGVSATTTMYLGIFLTLFGAYAITKKV